MIFKLLEPDANELRQRVEQKHGPGWRYVHSCCGLGPDGVEGQVDVFDNDAENWDDRRQVMVLDGKVLNPN